MYQGRSDSEDDSATSSDPDFEDSVAEEVQDDESKYFFMCFFCY